MNIKPTGQILGNNLIISRTFDASIDEVWMSVTKSEYTTHWFGGWKGEPGPGKTIQLQLAHEKGQIRCWLRKPRPAVRNGHLTVVA